MPRHLTEENTNKFYIKATGEINTTAIQSAINDHRIVEFLPGYHIIDDTLSVFSDTALIFQEGAFLRAAETNLNNLALFGRHMSIDFEQNIVIDGLNIVDPLADFDSDFEFLAGHIFITNANNVTIKNSRIQYVGEKVMNGVLISGPSAKYNTIVDSFMYGCGIMYCEDGASYTTVENVIVEYSKSNGLSGIGNGENADPDNDPSSGCRVINCTVQNAGRMGLEEIHTVRGTIVDGLKVINTGMNADLAVDGFGISMVSREWVLKNSHVENPLHIGIETFGNSGGVVDSCTVIWGDQQEIARTGITCNFTDNAEDLQLTQGVRIINNAIRNPTIGINIVGNDNVQATIENNNIVDPVKYGIFGDVSGTDFGIVNILNNTFEVRSPGLAGGYFKRALIQLYTSDIGVPANVINNYFLYQATATSSNKYEASLNIGWDNSIIANNVVATNDITATAGSSVEAYHSGGSPAAGLRFIGNRHIGTATNSTGGYTTPLLIGNTFDTGIQTKEDVRFNNSTSGVVFTAPNSTVWRVTIGDSGNLTATQL